MPMPVELDFVNESGGRVEEANTFAPTIGLGGARPSESDFGGAITGHI